MDYLRNALEELARNTDSALVDALVARGVSRCDVKMAAPFWEIEIKPDTSEWNGAGFHIVRHINILGVKPHRHVISEREEKCRICGMTGRMMLGE